MARQHAWLAAVVLAWLVATISATPVKAQEGSLEASSFEVAPSPEAVAALQLLESSDSSQCKVGFLRLEALREPATVSAIRQYVESRDAEMRADSLRALAAIEGAASVPLLLEKLRSDRRPNVRWAALLGLEPLAKSQPEILPAFIDALHDYNAEVRMAAVDAVSRIDDPRARAAIRGRFRKELRPNVRRVLHAAMKRLGPGS